MRLSTLKKSSDYRYMTAHGARFVAKGFVVLGCPSPLKKEDMVRFGIVASRKLGNAVRRNRVKRRLRALCREVLPAATGGWDYVLIGRYAGHDMDYARLLEDLRRALAYLAKGKA